MANWGFAWGSRDRPRRTVATEAPIAEDEDAAAAVDVGSVADAQLDIDVGAVPDDDMEQDLGAFGGPLDDGFD